MGGRPFYICVDQEDTAQLVLERPSPRTSQTEMSRWPGDLTIPLMKESSFVDAQMPNDRQIRQRRNHIQEMRIELRSAKPISLTTTAMPTRIILVIQISFRLDSM